MIDVGKKLAEEFIESGRDIFIMVTDVEGKEVSVTVKFAPPFKKITTEGVWNMLASRISGTLSEI